MFYLFCNKNYRAILYFSFKFTTHLVFFSTLNSEVFQNVSQFSKFSYYAEVSFHILQTSETSNSNYSTLSFYLAVCNFISGTFFLLLFYEISNRQIFFMFLWLPLLLSRKSKIPVEKAVLSVSSLKYYWEMYSYLYANELFQMLFELLMNFA